jgi:hypothetical protein
VVNSLWISGAEARILTLCCLERFAEAVECADHAAERFFASPFALYPLQCFVILAARAVARLGLATNEESRRAALLALVEADADEIGRVHPLLASYGALMLAGVATLRGNRLEAKAQLAGAVVATEPGLPYWPLLAGYRLAELDGDVARQGEIKAHAAVLGLQLADFAAGLAPGPGNRFSRLRFAISLLTKT